MSRTWGLARRLLLTAAAGVVALLLAEIALRLGGHRIGYFTERDPELGWRNKPSVEWHYTKEGDGQIVTNDLGLRDRPRTRSKPDGAFRIVVVGDSMTFGAEVGSEETFCRVAEARLAAAKPTVEVLNLGVVGYAPVQELMLLQRQGFAFAPDLVVVAAFVDNDIGGSSPAIGINPEGTPYASLDGGELSIDTSPARRAFDDFHREPKHMLREHSHLYGLAYRVLVDRLRAPPVAGGDGGGVPVSRFVYREPWPPEWEAAWAVTCRVYAQLFAQCRQRGVAVVVLDVPAGEAAHEPSWDALQHRYAAMAQWQWDRRGPSRRLAAFCAAQGVPLIAAFEPMAAAAARERLYFGEGELQVGHMTARGHAVLGRLLADELLRLGLVPGR